MPPGPRVSDPGRQVPGTRGCEGVLLPPVTPGEAPAFAALTPRACPLGPLLTAASLRVPAAPPPQWPTPRTQARKEGCPLDIGPGQRGSVSCSGFWSVPGAAAGPWLWALQTPQLRTGLGRPDWGSLWHAPTSEPPPWLPSGRNAHPAPRPGPRSWSSPGPPAPQLQDPGEGRSGGVGRSLCVAPRGRSAAQRPEGLPGPYWTCRAAARPRDLRPGQAPGTTPWPPAWPRPRRPLQGHPQSFPT